MMISSLYAPSVLGGAERVVQLLAEGLVQRGHVVVVVTTRPGGAAIRQEINGVKVYYVPLRNLYHPFATKHPPRLWQKAVWHAFDSYNPWMSREIEAIIKHEMPALIHTHNLAGFSVAAWGVCQGLNLPIVHTTHDHYLLCPKSNMFRHGKNCDSLCADCRLYAQPRQLASRKVDAVVGVSAYILNRHLEAGYFPRARQTQVIFNPYVGPHQKKTGKVKAPIRLGFLGRIHPTKGIETLIKVIAGLNGNFRLLIGGAGEAEYVAQLKKLAPHSTEWLGYISRDVLFENIDIFVFPSPVNETAGLVVQEALAVGIPVVAARRGGIPEVLGDGGWLFNPDAPHELASILRRFTLHPEEIVSRRERVWRRGLAFSGQETFDKYEDSYNSIVDLK